MGGKIEFIVSNCCTNVNLYDSYHCLRDDQLEAVWVITTRGRSQ